jgi:replicative DNA helicase
MIASAANDGHKAMMVTLEVNPVMVVMQLAATACRIGTRQLGYAHHADQSDFKTAIRGLSKMGITVTRRDKWLAQIIARAKAMKAREGLDMIAVDYCQLVKDIASLSTSEQVGAIGRVTTALKELAGDLDCVVVMASQFNRSPAKEGLNREPVISDLKGSGSLDSDADRILLIHRPNENPITSMPQDQTKSPEDCPKYFQNIIQGKSRDTGTAAMGMHFVRKIASFEPIK